MFLTHSICCLYHNIRYNYDVIIRYVHYDNTIKLDEQGYSYDGNILLYITYYYIICLDISVEKMYGSACACPWNDEDANRGDHDRYKY